MNGERKNMSKIFWDMDGTLNYFEKNESIDTVASPGYMKKRVPIRNMIGAMKIIEKAGMHNCIASSILPYPHCIPDKDYWCDMHINVPKERRYYNCCGESKADLLMQSGAEPGDIFIDDYTHNLNAVQNDPRCEGIICVKCVNDINDTHHSFGGARVSIYSSPEVIAAQLIGLHMYAAKGGN